MDLNEVLTLIIALWGAGLATILGIRELKKEQRRVKVILEFVRWVERYQLTIVNIGHRPITITEIGMVAHFKKDEVNPAHTETVPSNAVFELEPEKTTFPFNLTDGEYVNLPLSVVLSNYLAENKLNDLEIYVYDAEGHVFKDYQRREHDVKWGQYIQ